MLQQGALQRDCVKRLLGDRSMPGQEGEEAGRVLPECLDELVIGGRGRHRAVILMRVQHEQWDDRSGRGDAWQRGGCWRGAFGTLRGVGSASGKRR